METNHDEPLFINPLAQKRWGLMMFCGCFSSRGTGQLIALRGIKKSEDYIKILDENLQLLAQNLGSKLVIYFPTR